MPSIAVTAHISIRHFLGQRRQFVLHFPFFPSGAVTPENEEVWRMCMAMIAAGFGFVPQSERRRLVPVFVELILMVFHQVYGRQLIGEAFVLDGVPHLAAPEATAHVRATPLHTSHRL